MLADIFPTGKNHVVKVFENLVCTSRASCTTLPSTTSTCLSFSEAIAPSRAPVSKVKATSARLRKSISVTAGMFCSTCRICSIVGTDRSSGCLGDPCLLVRKREVLRVGGGQVRTKAGLRAEPLEEPAQRVERGEHRSPAQPLARALADLFGQFVLEADGLLNVEPFEVAIFGVGFELGERGRRAIDGVLAEAPGLLQVDEVGALNSLIFRVVHPAPAPSHSLRKDRHFPLCVAGLAVARPGVARHGRQLAQGDPAVHAGAAVRTTALRLPELAVIGR